MAELTESGALISECGLYRYRLWRTWDPELPVVAWVMLNPSTADGDQDGRPDTPATHSCSPTGPRSRPSREDPGVLDRPEVRLALPGE